MHKNRPLTVGDRVMKRYHRNYPNDHVGVIIEVLPKKGSHRVVNVCWSTQTEQLCFTNDLRRIQCDDASVAFTATRRPVHP